MAGFLVITGKGGSLGFRCAGLPCVEVEDASNISSTLVAVGDEGKIGLVAVEEKLLEKATEAVMRRIKKKGLPIIIPINIPHKWGEVEYGESPVVKLIRKAIGYQIKIKR
ncbi:MAG: hypothetical protein HY884_04710 [Deltaproteobacteria bacterium]|nr:hypothetical protein [Deltaproteobacteria bacterium]